MKSLTSLERSKLQLTMMSRLYDVFGDVQSDVEITPEFIQDTLVQFMQMKVESPYISLERYSKITGTPFSTCRAMVADGRISTMPRKNAKNRIEVNMMAMLKNTINNS
ncbi:hypothetical protein ABLA30_01920 [Xenorhabdus nematophila]|uniref:hypothetical protein n=1 Tax=Xenorhabdus nematophila TaxID=628 RepID=UPI0032B7303A